MYKLMYVLGIILFKSHFRCYILYMSKEDDKKLNTDFNGNSSRLKHFKACLNMNIE